MHSVSRAGALPYSQRCTAYVGFAQRRTASGFDPTEAFRRRGKACNPLPPSPVPKTTLDEYFANPHLKKRSVPIQLRQSGDLGGEGISAPGNRMLIDARTRKGPFFHLSQRAGAWTFTHYNRMYHPRCVISEEEGGMDAEYDQLCNRVAVVNVAVERQIQVKGPDAEKFVDMVITRRASSVKVGSAKYVVLCNRDGGIINDPVLLRPAEDEFWFSLADSDAGLYLQGVNAMGTFECTINEIDVAPLSIAGPDAVHVMKTMIGPIAETLPFYGRLHHTEIEGCKVVVTRSGFSAEANYEIFLYDAHRNAETLYDAVMAAGADWDIRETAIPHHSRIEGGLLSYGQDMDLEVNPFEVGLAWQVNLKKENFIGKGALAKIKAEGATHRLVGLRLGGKPINWYPADFYHVRDAPAKHGGQLVGYVTSAWFSPAQQSNIALAYLPASFAETGTDLSVTLPAEYAETGCVPATVVPVPFKVVDSAESRTGMSKSGGLKL